MENDINQSPKYGHSYLQEVLIYNRLPILGFSILGFLIWFLDSWLPVGGGYLW